MIEDYLKTCNRSTSTGEIFEDWVKDNEHSLGKLC
jgi:hypothetical protein